MTQKDPKAWRIGVGTGLALFLIALVVSAQAPAPTMDRGKPFVLTEAVRTDNGATIPAGTEVLIDANSSSQALSITLHLNATAETVAAKFRPITEKRDYLVLSYWVGKP